LFTRVEKREKRGRATACALPLVIVKVILLILVLGKKRGGERRGGRGGCGASPFTSLRGWPVFPDYREGKKGGKEREEGRFAAWCERGSAEGWSLTVSVDARSGRNREEKKKGGRIIFSICEGSAHPLQRAQKEKEKRRRKGCSPGLPFLVSKKEALWHPCFAALFSQRRRRGKERKKGCTSA